GVRAAVPPMQSLLVCFFFYFNASVTSQLSTLSLHDALPISCEFAGGPVTIASTLPAGGTKTWLVALDGMPLAYHDPAIRTRSMRSEEHTSELQSRGHLVCRLLLEKKKGDQLRRSDRHGQVCP